MKHYPALCRESGSSYSNPRYAKAQAGLDNSEPWAARLGMVCTGQRT